MALFRAANSIVPLFIHTSVQQLRYTTTAIHHDDHWGFGRTSGVGTLEDLHAIGASVSLTRLVRKSNRLDWSVFRFAFLRLLVLLS